MKRRLIAFEMTHAALEAEERLIDAGISAGIAPLPANIAAGCGFCATVALEDLARAKTVLAAAGIAHWVVHANDAGPP